MGILMDAQLEGYLALKKMGLNDAERLAHTSLTGGSYHVDAVVSGLKKIEEKTTDGEKNSVPMAAPSSSSTAASGGESTGLSEMEQIMRTILAEGAGAATQAEPTTEDMGNYFPDELDTDEIEEDEAVQVLLAITSQATPLKGRTWAVARKLAALKKTDFKGRSELPKEQRQSMCIEKLKARTKYAICKKVGHWHRGCPQAPNKEAVMFADL